MLIPLNKLLNVSYIFCFSSSISLLAFFPKRLYKSVIIGNLLFGIPEISVFQSILNLLYNSSNTSSNRAICIESSSGYNNLKNVLNV